MKILAGIAFCWLMICASAGPVEKPEKVDEKADIQSVRIITYNVLGREYAVKARIPELLRIIREEDPDIVALQEVAPWFIKLLRKDGLFKEYHTTLVWPAKKGEVRYGLCIFSKYKLSNIKTHKIESVQGRFLLSGDVQVGATKFRVVTMHLDSFLDAGDVRAVQLDAIWKIVGDNKNAIVLGDFNFGDGEFPETKHVSTDFLDLWRVAFPDATGYTWNMEESELAKKKSFHGEKSRRLDRILLKSDAFEPSTIKIIGNKPLNKTRTIFPSDHFGLSAVIVKKKTKDAIKE